MPVFEVLERAYAGMADEPAFWTTAVVLAAFGLVALVHYVARTLNAGRFAWQQRLRVWMGVAPEKRVGELFWLLLALHLVLWPVLVSVVLRIWGLHEEARELLRALFAGGVKVGKTTVVPGQVMLGLLWFVLLFSFTRWLKKKMEFSWLARTGIEFSLRESVATLFGYVTFLIAAIAGLSVAGLDFGKIAIVAGALSVGIGFGLQNIVNNFVSGLILLFERPIRTGDYIFVAGTEGVVRKIRIRSTEIQTLDRETVIVPNSELLSNPLRNLNLRDNYGRVIIKVGVAYGSDTLKVQQVLLNVALDNPHVMREGQVENVTGPAVFLTDFGDSALSFELRAYVLEVNQRLSVSSELRFSIEAAFRKEGIEIPFPQREVHLRARPAALAEPQEA